MTSSQWIDEWMRAWRSFPEAGESNPWTAMLDHFTKSQHAIYQQPFAEALNRITEQSRAFFDMGQGLASNDGGDWQQSVLTYLDEVAGRLRDPQAAAPAFAGASPLEYWRQLAGHDGRSPGDQQSFLSRAEKLLQMPGMGYTREHQESLQELGRLWLAYEQAHGDYTAYCAGTAARCVDRLRDRLKAEFDQGGGPQSVRGLYDSWVACNEEVYAERVATEEYMKLHGQMVNALMAYRKHAGELMDQWAEAANMPTRREVDALHRRLKDVRQELRGLKARLDDEPSG